MGYSGIIEYLDEDGFYWYHDEPHTGFNRNPEKLNPNGKVPVWHRIIHTTNGMDEDEPSTYWGDKTSIGMKDVWHVDHYGNKYATQQMLCERQDAR